MRVINEQTLTNVLESIKNYQKKEGRSPSFRQIVKDSNLASISTAQRYIKVLRERGLIEQNKYGGIETPINLEANKSINIAPLVGEVACGELMFAEENIEGNYALPTSIFGHEDLMILRAKGESMIGVGIFDGDLIVAKRCETAESGDIVVARVDDTATVKTLERKNGKNILHPANPLFKDIETDNLAIQGIVKHVIHSF